MTSSNSWLALQIGAREHYAIPRALHQRGQLQALLTDHWLPPASLITRLPGTQRLSGRWHPDLESARVLAPGYGALLREVGHRVNPFARHGRPTHARNRRFQAWAARTLAAATPLPPSIFSYSYAALQPFQIAKAQGCRTVLGQIDCGPAEDRVVAEERRRYPQFDTSWRPEPSGYWDRWRQELSLADRIVVNSRWSYRCMVEEGIPQSKLKIIPLVYQAKAASLRPASTDLNHSPDVFRLLFLGTVGLRKGIARLLEAMRILENHPVVLTLAGPSELDPAIWAGCANIRWLGPLPRSAVAAAYASADAMILPSLSDGFAITQLESLANQCPVIASRNCGDVVEPGVNGWLLANLEPETIAATVLQAMDTRNQLRNPLPMPTFGIGDLGQALSSLFVANSEPVDRVA
jgi:glycosyltransferase involved in cell wall biosynthesis